jgi:hypothetical protein
MQTHLGIWAEKIQCKWNHLRAPIAGTYLQHHTSDIRYACKASELRYATLASEIRYVQDGLISEIRYVQE